MNPLFEILKNKKGMDLLPEEIKLKIPPLYSQENESDPICHVKYFSPVSDWTWFGIEYSPEERVFFGFVHGFDDELGYFSLDELESMGGLIERDLYFEPQKLSDIKRQFD